MHLAQGGQASIHVEREQVITYAGQFINDNRGRGNQGRGRVVAQIIGCHFVAGGVPVLAQKQRIPMQKKLHHPIFLCDDRMPFQLVRMV